MGPCEASVVFQVPAAYPEASLAFDLEQPVFQLESALDDVRRRFERLVAALPEPYTATSVIRSLVRTNTNTFSCCLFLPDRGRSNRRSRRSHDGLGVHEAAVIELHGGRNPAPARERSVPIAHCKYL